METVLQTRICLMTGGLVELACQLLDRRLARPWLGPHPSIHHRELEQKRLFVGTGDVFDPGEVPSYRERSQIGEIGRVDHYGVALPMAERVTQPVRMFLVKCGRPSRRMIRTGWRIWLGFDGEVSE